MAFGFGAIRTQLNLPLRRDETTRGSFGMNLAVIKKASCSDDAGLSDQEMARFEANDPVVTAVNPKLE